MLRIKLMPFGRKHLHHYRISVVEAKEKLTSDPTIVLGTYDAKAKKIVADNAQIKVWIAKGAQPSATLRKLLGL